MKTKKEIGVLNSKMMKRVMKMMMTLAGKSEEPLSRIFMPSFNLEVNSSEYCIPSMPSCSYQDSKREMIM